MQRIGWQVNQLAVVLRQSPLQLNRLVGCSGERRRGTKLAAAEQVKGIRAEGVEGGSPPYDPSEACDFPLHSVADTPLTHCWPGEPLSFP